MTKTVEQLDQLATACMESERAQVESYHQLAGSCAQAAALKSLDERSREIYRMHEAEHLVKAIWVHDPSLTAAELLTAAAIIAARGNGAPVPFVARPEPSVGDPFDYSHAGKPAPDARPVHVRAFSLRDIREIAAGLYVGRDQGGELRLFDGQWCRGYVNANATPKKPFGHRVHVWGRRGSCAEGLELRRTYPTRAEAERQLIAQGLKLEADAAEMEAMRESSGRAAFREGLPRDVNPISTAQLYAPGRAAWFRGYDREAQLASEKEAAAA